MHLYYFQRAEVKIQWHLSVTLAPKWRIFFIIAFFIVLHLIYSSSLLLQITWINEQENVCLASYENLIDVNYLITASEVSTDHQINWSCPATMHALRLNQLRNEKLKRRRFLFMSSQTREVHHALHKKTKQKEN